MVKTGVKVIYNNQDLSADISARLSSFRYTDNLEGKADDLTITLNNTDRAWCNQYHPPKGATIEVSLLKYTDDVTDEFYLGKFNIDETECSNAPDIFNIKAVTTAADTKFKNTVKLQRYENITIKNLINKLANQNNLSLDYKTKLSHTIKKITQNDISDNTFIYNLCVKYGLIYKLTDKRIIIYDELPGSEKFILKPEHKVAFKNKSYDVFGSVKIKYFNTKKGEKIEYNYKDEKIQSDKILVLKQTAESIADAELIAKAALRRTNSKEITGSVSGIDGTGDLYSGMILQISGYGVYDNNYKISVVNHEITPTGGYTNSIDFEGI